jgi:hypothetical protein
VAPRPATKARTLLGVGASMGLGSGGRGRRSVEEHYGALRVPCLFWPVSQYTHRGPIVRSFIATNDIYMIV